MTLKKLVLGCAALGLAAGASAGIRFTLEQLDARYYYDLGPDEVDVESYPDEQLRNYLVFTRACSQCHTLARPINSPLSVEEDWRRYLSRMKKRTESHPDTALSKADLDAALSFLVYDSKKRKVEGKEAFEQEQKDLKWLFEIVQRERSRRQIADDRAKARPGAPYTGTK